MSGVAGAIADPVRREILVMLRHTRLSAGEIAERFSVSRPAVSRHLRVLRESGLVTDEADGRRRLYALDPSRLAQLTAWLAQFEQPSPWAQRFDALGTEVARARRDRRHRERADEGRPGGTTRRDSA
ncbi:ArsR family transcriptional regulator [Streptomyces radicis]|uniref:ArsR family transcriptional regulator n=1 Tax=Streptomyces radicis TaxID=1750517 RepID=A0A3A9WQG5_9ACTN|nr:ArsR family transcriptional regulator [Streptomyces radicis]RKN21642.1 ArsR family transcriptional regulator [Streptomyces radicis]